MIVDSNSSNSPDGDVVFGYISDFKDSQSAFQTNSSNGYNAVKVRLRKDSSVNGEVPYFFARIFGMNGQPLHSEATAGLVRDVRGFQAPADGSNLGILPYALDLTNLERPDRQQRHRQLQLERHHQNDRKPGPTAWSR